MEEFFQGAKEKALKINLDPSIYGTFAEIGAGQEVARFFFQAGGASGTVAKTMSAYDMVFSDSIYGKDPNGRYVSESRLMQMLDKEYDLVIKRLSGKRHPQTKFFAFANTVTALSYKGNNESHGWIGLRFQAEPSEAASDVIIHVRMLDKQNVLQQQALGVIGVNLIYAAFFKKQVTQDFVRSLVDDLTPERIEVDYIKVSGPAFTGIDNRVLSLQLVKNEMTKAVMFDALGKAVQASEVLYKKNILVLRGSFRPPTLLNLDMIQSGLRQFKQEEGVSEENTLILAEITLINLREGGELDEKDFLARVDLLTALGQTVIISNYHEYYKLAAYFSRYTKKRIGIILGAYNLQEVFQTEFYAHLPGGILESLGILFNRDLNIYVYPAENPQKTGLLNCQNFPIEKSLVHIFEHFVENRMIQDIEQYDEEVLPIYSLTVLQMIQRGESGWEKMVPAMVAKTVKKKCLFGYPCSLEEKKKIEEEEQTELLRQNKKISDS